MASSRQEAQDFVGKVFFDEVWRFLKEINGNPRLTNYESNRKEWAYPSISI
jgi:hypothetical protein